jgi:5-dehydro-2-deoxygluconokinase
LLIEIISGKNGPMDKTTVARAMQELYDLGIKPDWWKLEPQADGAAWNEIGKVIDKNDPLCRGIVLLGLDAPEDELAKGFAAVADKPHVKGFAVGRTIFLEAAEAWLAGKMTDAAAIDNMAAKYASLVKLWNDARLGAH